MLILFSGHLAERINLRHFLTIGMLLGGFTTALFGLAYFLEIHWLPYFFAVQVLHFAFKSGLKHTHTNELMLIIDLLLFS